MSKGSPVKSVLKAELLAKIQAILVDDKARIEGELAKFSKPGQKDSAGSEPIFPDYGDSEEDNAVEVADYEANLSIESDLQKSLRDVDSSLKRILSGEYGTCKYCKKIIDEKRLMARPTSSACVECKKTIAQEA
jgi:DnaK suppressor protein